MSDNEREYFERRTGSANRLAEAATDPGIRKIHEGMARTYGAKAAEAPNVTRPTLSVVTG